MVSTTLAQAADSSRYQTFTYYEDDTVALALDLFLPKLDSGTAPVLLFVHGGGFSGGDRSGGHDLGDYLSRHGYAVASISYSLYMRGRSFSCDAMLPQKVKAIQVAANHTWLATAYLIAQAEALGLDPERIILAGSSAGAETVLQAAYWDREQMNWYEQPCLPDSFRYAGVISGAGAALDLNVMTAETAIPTMLFHGDQDPLVPFGTAAHHYCPPNAPGWLMLFGSQSIYQHLVGLDAHVEFVSYAGGGHEYAGHHFHHELSLILDFLTAVEQGEQRQFHWRRHK